MLFALAVATKVQYTVALPAFLVYLGWRIMQGRRSLATPALWLVGLLAGLIPLFIYNTLIFGSPLDTGYGSNPASTLTTPILQGALGLLLSPGKGLLWYAFPIVLTFFGWVPFARKHRAEAAFIVLLFLSVLALFSVYSFWPGDGSWGPRYLSPALAFLLLPILPVIERAIPEAQVAARSRVSIVRLAVSAVIALGFLSNLLGVLVNFDTYINVVNDNNSRYWTTDGLAGWP